MAIKEIELTNVNMSPGDVLVVTIKSDGIKQGDIGGIRDGFKKRFSDNDCLIFAVAPGDSIELTKVSAEVAAKIGTTVSVDDVNQTTDS